MFFIISKILSYFLSPLLWIILLLITAICTRKDRKRKKYLLLSLIVILLFSNSLIVFSIVKFWTVSPVTEENLTGVYDVGIVLGGNTITFDKNFHRKTYTANIDRLLQAVSLYYKGKIKKILVTGAAGDLIYRDHKEANLMSSFLRSIGIPDSNILIDTMAENTHQNALYVKRLLSKRDNNGRLLLITSSLHMRRARACFIHEGMNTTVYATNPIDTKIRWNFEFLIMPDASNILIWNGLIHEVFGYAVYWLNGYI